MVSQIKTAGGSIHSARLEIRKGYRKEERAIRHMASKVPKGEREYSSLDDFGRILATHSGGNSTRQTATTVSCARAGASTGSGALPGFGDYLRAARLRAKLSQRKLATKVGLSLAAVVALEHSLMSPELLDDRTLRNLAKTVDEDIEDFGLMVGRNIPETRLQRFCWQPRIWWQRQIAYCRIAAKRSRSPLAWARRVLPRLVSKSGLSIRSWPWKPSLRFYVAIGLLMATIVVLFVSLLLGAEFTRKTSEAQIRPLQTQVPPTPPEPSSVLVWHLENVELHLQVCVTPDSLTSGVSDNTHRVEICPEPIVLEDSRGTFAEMLNQMRMERESIAQERSALERYRAELQTELAGCEQRLRTMTLFSATGLGVSCLLTLLWSPALAVTLRRIGTHRAQSTTARDSCSIDEPPSHSGVC